MGEILSTYSLKRWLQKLAAGIWISVLLFSGTIGCLVVSLLIIYSSIGRWIVVLYVILIYTFDWNTCERGGWSERWIDSFRNSVWWRYFCDYFPIKIIKTANLDPSRNYFFCCFPHGVMCAGIFGALCTNAAGFKSLYPGLRCAVLTLVPNFKMPFFREFLYSIGCCSTSKQSIEYLLSTPKGGRAVTIMPGGAREASYCDSNRVLLRNRTGFVKLALKHGTPLVPVYAFGETELYGQVHFAEGSWFGLVQKFVRNIIGYYIILPIGTGLFQDSFGLIPRRRPVTVVVGPALELPKIIEPSTEEILRYRMKFEEALNDLFETHKRDYLENSDDQHLRFE